MRLIVGIFMVISLMMLAYCCIALHEIANAVQNIEYATCDEEEEDDIGSFMAWGHRVGNPPTCSEVCVHPKDTGRGEVR